MTTVKFSSRRRDILEAALVCFSETGFSATTMEDVRLRSGASIGSMYHHFEGKEHIAAALLVEGVTAFQEEFVRVLVEQRDARAGIESTVSYYLDWVQQKPLWARYLLERRYTNMAGATEDELAEQNSLFFRRLFEWLRPHVEARRLVDMPMDLLFAVWTGPVQTFARQWLAGRGRTDMRLAKPALCLATWNALAGTGVKPKL